MIPEDAQILLKRTQTRGVHPDSCVWKFVGSHTYVLRKVLVGYIGAHLTLIVAITLAQTIYSQSFYLANLNVWEKIP